MSTTIQYKGNTLATVSNNTKTLKTAGKYMEGDVVLTDVSGGSEAISVVDTLDANGGTIRTITALDISDTTAVASDVAQGKYFYTADGTKTAGTSSGGGGGLEYETGTWTPSEDTNKFTITFSNTHTVAPFYYLITDATGTYSDVTNSNYWLEYVNHHQFAGEGTYESSTMIHYGEVRTTNRGGSTTSFVNGTISQTSPYTSSASSSTADSRYWATETGINAYTNSTSRYWRAGRTYKWIAVWAPTT